MVGITINAQSSIRLEGSKTVYFDPFQIKDERHDADFIFITHEHFDHFSPDDIAKVANENTVMVSPLSMRDAVEKVKSVGDKVSTDVELSRKIDLNGVMFRAVRAYNVGKPFHQKESNWVGYKVYLDGETFFVTGDTDANEENLQVYCDVLLVPCGGKYTFNAEEAADFAARIKPGKAIPTHYGNVVGSPDDGERFVRELKKKAPDIETEILL